MALQVEEFERHLTATREAKTVESYMTAVRAHLVPWLNSRAPETRYTPTLLQEFIDHMCEKGLMPASVQLYHQGARMFLIWVRKKGEPVPDQESVTLPRINQPVNQIIRPEDLREFMDGARKEADPYATCLMILPLTGLRIGEAVSLELTNLIVTPGSSAGPGGFMFLVKGTKGKRDRYVPMLKSGTLMFRDYLINVRPSLPGDRWIFPSPKSSKQGQMSIHPRVVQDIMKNIRNERGLSFTPHTLRHVYATVLHREGISDIVKAKLLGHKSVNTTQRYIHLTPEELHSDVANVETPWADTTRPTTEGDDDEQ